MEKLKRYWPIFALILIFMFSFFIRSINIQPDMLVQFDPTFQLRFTQYIVNWGHLPVWDEISYYVGRANSVTSSPFMWYLTALLFIITKSLGISMSLMTFVEYASALYGALAVFPAYFLVKEFSNKYGGLLGATLIATAPQILVRTFGGSYDTDQMVVLFMLASLFTLVYALKRRTVASGCLAVLTLSAFMATWGLFVYSIVIVAGFVFVEFILSYVMNKKNEGAETGLKKHYSDLKKKYILMAEICAATIATGLILKISVINDFMALFAFALSKEAMIVNISIAELQAFDIFNMSGWMTSLGNFVIGDGMIDLAVLIIFTSLIIVSIIEPFKKRNMFDLAFVLTLLVVGIYTTFRGIRFTEFSSMLFLCAVAIGFGKLADHVRGKDIIIKSSVFGLGLLLVLFAMSMGMQLGKQLGPENPTNWMDAWNFLKTETPELSIVGTWWDPGHMIATLAERRNFADGAHCEAADCMYGINDRITSLGKIMATDNETESLRLVNKYIGDSPKAYWIASSDLISKFQWCQYFGTGCDARVDPNCQLYMPIAQSNTMYMGSQIFAKQYSSVWLIQGITPPIPLLIQNRVGMLPKEIIFYSSTGNVTSVKMNENLQATLIDYLSPYEQVMGIRMSNQTYDYSVWIDKNEGYIVLIPPRLREAVFTKMFMLEGQGLEHFRQVFRNEEVKIYEVVF